MTLDEAIERYTSNAEYEQIHGNLQGCLEFRQLAEWLKDYKRLLDQDPCEDAISVMDLLNNLHKYFSIGFEHDEWWNSTHVLQAIKDCDPDLFDPKAEPKPCKVNIVPEDDAINRQELLDAFWKLDIELRPNAIDSILNMINDISPVTPQLKTGRWMAQDIHNCHTDFKCSNCGYIHNFIHLFLKPEADYTYCPRCGAKMVDSESEGEE